MALTATGSAPWRHNDRQSGRRLVCLLRCQGGNGGGSLGLRHRQDGLRGLFRAGRQNWLRLDICICCCLRLDFFLLGDHVCLS